MLRLANRLLVFFANIYPHLVKKLIFLVRIFNNLLLIHFFTSNNKIYSSRRTSVERVSYQNRFRTCISFSRRSLSLSRPSQHSESRGGLEAAAAVAFQPPGIVRQAVLPEDGARLVHRPLPPIGVRVRPVPANHIEPRELRSRQEKEGSRSWPAKTRRESANDQMSENFLGSPFMNESPHALQSQDVSFPDVVLAAPVVNVRLLTKYNLHIWCTSILCGFQQESPLGK